MTQHYPTELQDVLEGNLQSLGNSNVTAFKVRGSRFTFPSSGADLLVADTLSFGFRRAGDLPLGVILSSTANLSAASLAIGIAGATAKYKAAAALPNATSVFVPFIGSALDDAPLAAREEMIGTISGATIPAGTLIVIPVYGAR